MISIICFGNSLCSDDGVGETVFRQLKAELEAKPELTEFIQLYYGGNSGQRALPYFINCAHVIVVDAILNQVTQELGRIHRLSEGDLSLVDDGGGSVEFSSHVFAFPQSWRLLKELRTTLPQLTLFAIEIADTTPYHEGLTPEADNAAHLVTLQVMQLCCELV